MKFVVLEGIIEGITESRKVMKKNRRLMYPEKYGIIKQAF
jgi:hypothetical protein